jgi:hypothetical protein
MFFLDFSRLSKSLRQTGHLAMLDIVQVPGTNHRYSESEHAENAHI